MGVEAMPAGLDVEKGVDLILADADPGAKFWQIEVVQAPGGALERGIHGVVLSAQVAGRLMFATDCVK
ncbi:hypothetical protein [Mesorhizobium sp.]|uniref:hypothetical protein n=1 Tax=Mesorhizobium sp. TaxID=1871066 RepID=UPI00257ED97E|nr:hypothetical protein [Mesorhizobium sp.]